MDKALPLSSTIPREWQWTGNYIYPQRNNGVSCACTLAVTVAQWEDPYEKQMSHLVNRKFNSPTNHLRTSHVCVEPYRVPELLVRYRRWLASFAVDDPHRPTTSASDVALRGTSAVRCRRQHRRCACTEQTQRPTPKAAAVRVAYHRGSFGGHLGLRSQVLTGFSPFEPSSGCKRNKGMYKESAVAGLRGRRREGKSSPKEGQDFQFDSLTESEGNTSAAGVASRSPLKHHLDGVVLRATQSTVRG
eukprot:1183636-Prorocentrum_minimum.AAC.3